MSTQVRLTLHEYEEMIRRGEFEPRETHHVELIQGEIRSMSPIGLPHVTLVIWLTEWSIRTLPEDAAWVAPQCPVLIAALESEPEPDLVWARREVFPSRKPSPEDVLLLIEVSDSSLAFDRGEKANLYAAAGIADYWIVNIPERCLEIRRDPEAGSYKTVRVLRPGEEARPLAFPEIALAVSRLFPE